MPALTGFNDMGTTAVACTQLRASYPIPHDPTAIVYSQDFIVPFANYVAPTISATNADVATAYLIGDSELTDLGAGVARYTRQWATIPANRNEWGTKDYEFIGYIVDGGAQPPFENYWNVPPEGGRDPHVQRVKQRLYHEYFLCKTGHTYVTPDLIPVVPAQEYYLDDNVNAKRKYLLPVGIFVSDTVPTTEDYLDMVDDEDEIVSEDSDIQRVYGEIYVRITPYIVAI